MSGLMWANSRVKSNAAETNAHFLTQRIFLQILWILSVPIQWIAVCPAPIAYMILAMLFHEKKNSQFRAVETHESSHLSHQWFYLSESVFFVITNKSGRRTPFSYYSNIRDKNRRNLSFFFPCNAFFFIDFDNLHCLFSAIEN